MGPEFFQTRMGQRFYEAMVPRIAESLEKIAVELKRANDLKEAGEQRMPSPEDDEYAANATADD